MRRRWGMAVLIVGGLLAACAKDVTYERGLTADTRKSLGTVRLLTVVVQDELGVQYHTRSTTAKLLNTAQIHGVAFTTKGALYIGPAPDSMTPWIDTSDYVPEGIQDMPGVVSALDPSNALRTVAKIAFAPVLRATEKSEHQKSGDAAYTFILPARAAMKKVKVRAMLREDQTRELQKNAGIKFAARDLSSEWPLTILQKGVQPKEKPLLLLFTQYTLTPDLRQLQVQTEATLMRAGDKIEAPSYRNRFSYESPKLPIPGKPVEAGAEQTPWEKDLLNRVMLARWTKDGGKMLEVELHRASDIIAADMAMDLAGRFEVPKVEEPKAEAPKDPKQKTSPL